jgi:hypothetical protein
MNHLTTIEEVEANIRRQMGSFSRKYPASVTFAEAMSALENLTNVTVFWDGYGLDTILTAEFRADVDEKGALALTRGMLFTNYGYGFIEWAQIGRELIAADAFTSQVAPGTRRPL